MRPNVQINYDGLKSMAREIAAISGKDYAFILRSEGASMIKIAALKSPIASAAAIKRQVTERTSDNFHSTDSGNNISVNVRKNAGRVWFTDDPSHYRGPNGRGYMIFDQGPTKGHHVPDTIWSEYLFTVEERDEYIKIRIAELKKRRGIERLSWLQMGDAIGVQLSTVSPAGNLNEELARGARVHGTQYQDGFSQDVDAGAQFTIICTNQSPAAIKRHGQFRMDAAINQRIAGFQIALRKGLLDDMTRRAKRWPGIFVS